MLWLRFTVFLNRDWTMSFSEWVWSTPRSVARQIVTHGHVLVEDGEWIFRPRVSIGNKITVRTQSSVKAIFKEIDVKMKKHNPPVWLKLDKVKRRGNYRNAGGRQRLIISSPALAGFNKNMDYKIGLPSKPKKYLKKGTAEFMKLAGFTPATDTLSAIP